MGAITANMVIFLFLSIIIADSEIADTQHLNQNQIQPGSSLYPTTHPTSWPSPSGLFAFGFYQQSNGFAIGIWLVGKNNNHTVVWTANRDDPPLTSNATLQLTKDGKLVLQPRQGQQQKLIADISNATASSASMLDSGNFVLYNNNFSVIWQSFDYPTDTILGDQSLNSGAQLFSNSSQTSHSTGRFRLKMQLDGNLVLYPRYTTDTSLDSNWASGTNNVDGFKYHLYLNKTGSLLIWNDSDSSPVKYLYDASRSTSKIDDENMTIYRATLDVDGFFRLYVHGSNDASNSSEVSNWPQNVEACTLKGTCGFNSYCTVNDQTPYCNCLPGFDFIDPNQNALGCNRTFSEAKCGGEKENRLFYNMTSMENLVWGSNDHSYAQATMSQEECSSSCLDDCNCWAALYQNGVCMKQEPPLRFARRISTNERSSSIALLKVGSLSLIDPDHKHWPFGPDDHPPQIKITSETAIVKVILVTSCFVLLLCSTIGISSFLICKIRVLRYKRLLEIGGLGLNEEVALRRFSYSELKKATNGFKHELGSGYFGTVYKGVLYKGKRRRRLIAVKRLERLVKEGERQFQAEVRAIGKTHHKNLVRLLGFCADGPKRLLVYEYMSNGSLGDLLFGDVAHPNWDERVRIALDIARGILYLHEECEAPIIHCDIKPQNILMDEFWTAKISDFGLAKLLMPDQTRTFTDVRGTKGYLAPEWNKNTPITVKADIYSYGVLLLETICCRRNIEVNISKPEETLLSGWAYECFVARELHKLVPWETVDINVLENMVKVALWCIQDEPVLRPSMKSVVLMLEGVIDIAIPPGPTSNST